MLSANKTVRKIRLSSSIGLWGSLFLVAMTVAEHYLANYVWERVITTNDYTRHLFLITGLVLVVVDVAVILFTLRKQIPRIRQLDDVEEKLHRYKGLVKSVFLVTMVVVLLVSAIIVISHENTLIMLLLLLIVMLMLNYPNMYKIKADLGLDDQQMKELFGDAYISNNNEEAK